MAMNRRRVALEALCREHSVAILYSFGSRAKEVLAWLDDPEAVLDPGPPDVDIGVKPVRLPSTLSAGSWRQPKQDATLDLKAEVALTHDLEDFLGVQRVGLVNLDSANPFLAAEIIHGERLYAEDEYAADNFDLYIMGQVADLAFLEEESACLLLGIAT
jgi:hypothetical protein